MTKDYLSCKTCEQLAQQLVDEQAELFRHQALIDSIKMAIYQKKLEVITRKTKGKAFMIDGKVKIVTDVESFMTENNMCFSLTFATQHVGTQIGSTLTKTERDLLSKYENLFEQCKYYLDDDLAHRIYYIGKRLKDLKNGIGLVNDSNLYHFNYDDASKPGFFDETGIKVEVKNNITRAYEAKTLEDLRIRVRR